LAFLPTGKPISLMTLMTLSNSAWSFRADLRYSFCFSVSTPVRVFIVLWYDTEL